MSTASLSDRPTRTTALPPPKGRAGFGGALVSEWTKLRSVRSTVWILLILVAATAAIDILSSTAWAHNLPQTAASGSGATTTAPVVLDTGHLEGGDYLGQLIAIVLGAIGVASEFSTGMIRTTLSVQPRRGTVFFAKLTVLTVVSLVVGEFIAFGAYFISTPLISSDGVHFTLSDSATLVGVIGGGLYLTGCALMAFGLAALFRNTAAGIAVPVALLLVVDIIVHSALPTSWQTHVVRYVPMEAGPQIFSTQHTPGENLAAWTGFGVFMIYVVVCLAVGWWSFTRRDA